MILCPQKVTLLFFLLVRIPVLTFYVTTFELKVLEKLNKWSDITLSGVIWIKERWVKLFGLENVEWSCLDTLASSLLMQHLGDDGSELRNWRWDWQSYMWHISKYSLVFCCVIWHINFVVSNVCIYLYILYCIYIYLATISLDAK